MARSENTRLSLVLVAALGAALGCTAPRQAPSTEAVRSTLATSNSFARNGLTTNGIWTNGIWTNGIWTNGIWTNGIWTNGIWTNGIWTNGIWTNGIWTNGIWTNGIWTNGIWTNGLTGDARAPGDALRNSVYARQLLRYVYECAMPAATYDTQIDPNMDAAGNGSIACSETDVCDDGYTCSSEGKCVVPLEGAIGLAINDDGSTWWGDFKDPATNDRGKAGQCDESCQRWISACVLARTNAYGVRVAISLRAPTVVPPGREVQFAKIQAALEASATEMGAFPQREGAFYGNIFATTPVNPVPSVDFDGPTDGPIAATPRFYACAGPDSNVPQITRRFCSSRGDQSVINVPGVCWPPASGVTEPPICNGIDETGSIYGCFTSTDRSDPRNRFDEVITVYLAQAIATCGNAVCEAPGEDAASCPSDCHPGGWAKSIGNLWAGSAGIGIFDYRGPSAISAIDDTIILVGFGFGIGEVDLGGPLISPGGDVFVAKYTRDGAFVWGTTVDMSSNRQTVAVATDGSIVVAGWGPQPAHSAGMLRLAKLTADGHLVSGWPKVVGGMDAFTAAGGLMARDSQDNILLSGYFQGTARFETTPPTVLTETSPDTPRFVVKVRPDGTPAWVTHFQHVESLAVDPSDNVLLIGGNPGSRAFLRLEASTGTATNLRPITASVSLSELVADSSGDLYVTGNIYDTYDFGAGCGVVTAATGSWEFFLAKYSADGSTCRWVARATTVCPPGAIYCDAGHFEGGALAFDHAGNVLVGGRLHGVARAPVLGMFGPLLVPGIGAVVDFGAGPFSTFRFPSAFVASYGSDTGNFRWAKQIPIVLQGNLRGVAVDSRNHVVVNGTYTGSMQLDDRLLITSQPEIIHNFGASTYIGAFAPPSLGDGGDPDIGGGVTDPAGQRIDTVPSDIYTQPTGPDGANVFFMPPTAVDSGNAGTNVVCSPPPNTTFPVGTTQVTCTASDPVGNSSTATFNVTVADVVGPAFPPVIPDVTQPATGANGAVVPYPVPAATDQHDGARPVTCVPAPGSQFPIGTTTVTCTSGDTSGNQAQTTFNVVVTATFGGACTSQSDCGAGSCVDGVCCNTAAASCGACQACNVPGSLGTCAPTSGGACDDGNACTAADVCMAGACVGGADVSCDDQNPCTVDSCSASSGCAHQPGNPGAICRAADNACDSAEVCTGSSASCPGSADKAPPTLGPGNDQTLVGNCKGRPVAFAVPALAGSSCESGTKVTCTWSSGGHHGTCARTAEGTSLPGDRYGAFTVTCKARDAAGNVSAPAVFKVTVLEPLTVRIQEPLEGDNNTVSNVVKLGSTVETKVRLLACGSDVTRSASVIAKIHTTHVSSGDARKVNKVDACKDPADTGGVMRRDGRHYRYNLSTKGLSATAGVPGFHQVNITVAYKSAPGVVVGANTIQLDPR